MKIEVGEYVRTKKGKIFEVAEVIPTIGKEIAIVKNKNGYSKRVDLKEEKHSKDITDLIEVGDVIEIHFPVRNTIKKIYVDEYFEDSMILNGIINGNVILKTILTKEMYLSNCYTVERKE